MTVQNYIGQFQQNARIDLNETDSMIRDMVEQILMDIFNEGDTGQITIDENYYTKSEIRTMLNDYLTKTLAESTYASKTELEAKIASIDLSNYATDSEVAEAVEALNETVQNNYCTKTDVKTKIDIVNDVQNTLKSGVEQALTNCQNLYNNLSINYYSSGYLEYNILSNYLKSSSASGTYATITSLNDYLTKTQASNDYPAKGAIGNYYNKTEVDGLISAAGSTVTNYYETTENNTFIDERSEPMISNLSSWSAGGDLGLDANWKDVPFGHDVFVAVGYIYQNNGVAAYSTTAGKSWTPSTGVILTTNALWESVAYGKGRFMAVGATSRGGGDENYIAYSDDFGKTWTLAENVPQGERLTYVAYGGGRFIAMGNGYWGETRS